VAAEGPEGPSVCIACVETQAHPPKCLLQCGFLVLKEPHENADCYCSACPPIRGLGSV
jgi:hypothetical protein